jgi:hypothetical protein
VLRFNPSIRVAWWVHAYLLGCVALSWIGVDIDELKMHRRAARGISVPN